MTRPIASAILSLPRSDFLNAGRNGGEFLFGGLLQIEWVIFVILRAIPVFDGDAIADW